MKGTALLVLEDGTKFRGRSIGVEGESVGELVFNTSMTGYQEILTDPSYSNQIVVFTYPHIGNVGINELDNESSRIQVSGLVVRDLSLVPSNFRHVTSLSDYLVKQNVVGISNIDTRRLVCLLRDKGVQNGCIISGANLDVLLALRKARAFSHVYHKGLLKSITTNKKYTWTSGSVDIYSKRSNSQINLPYHVVIYDFGIKYNIMRMLVDRGCRLTIVPAKTAVSEILNMRPDGIFLSNGPGDPALYTDSIACVRCLLDINIPIFGICLGHQLLALASGAKVIKMKFGHHGANHPVKDLLANKVLITTQNHVFTVDDKSLPKTLEITHISLFDGTLEGIRYLGKPIFSCQWHPEGSPGPHDSQVFFDDFASLIKIYHNG
ncbi:glutamine-hydrolyzing carbamoyl-phosphate synthase small subunit [Blochmannia endosymbiont of Polyrhachis (Hedomyrma) turneri]|uniref:glutamine-hydrolyzing carbamoyl-phosphate synthase small subunit n=1 Tax=Blochmannia endosymbiont of Polyrhachis (Hedomyrma) turneri TaxID=1505596 RepID=UPI00061A7DBE|nr:glutamine-hydrolyzing carbamoyl-phosphate synthase small subunit [Blochmannia endosymbiont of Polyrhachis (Hedomyrma) turneri]AKC59705.1 Carbamoyl-phosphate synthase small chain [Blochmannia endosymbiont of Polyrhachis (Hedomyrma) turneri]